ncbi:uncharacterized protein AMSG_01446 [Thecamonas trahens ATCC 50062]|uniref:Uncharacterized protein n=1 Tax=Thecamonas trahens ATCC 50062 TaxID=461836 RepID=A0A0L0DQN8_THETB|nr:hypothetical protein AMSG_01446 [Thecamonas trahens ATCC 50062]KNC54590.1 hypothetical protein AMSG_01446 [Thecamonas trahens ATCC 50062]|eukprot:XP_013761499.1 hypothetical protein AMSG_01446 [Thecamonas trahens ATCC 50062]
MAANALSMASGSLRRAAQSRNSSRSSSRSPSPTAERQGDGDDDDGWQVHGLAEGAVLSVTEKEVLAELMAGGEARVGSSSVMAFPASVPMLPKIYGEVARLGASAAARLDTLALHAPVGRGSAAAAALERLGALVREWGGWMHKHGVSGTPLPRSGKGVPSPEYASMSADVLVAMDTVFWASSATLWLVLEEASARACATTWLASSCSGVLSSRDGAGGSHALVDAPDELRVVLEAVYSALKFMLRKEARLAAPCVAAFRADHYPAIEIEMARAVDEVTLYNLALGLETRRRGRS